MKEERTGKCLRQLEHIRGHLWHRYSITVNQVMLATVKLSKRWLQLSQEELLASVTFLLAATLYQGNHDRNHKLRNIVSTERYILHIKWWIVSVFLVRTLKSTSRDAPSNRNKSVHGQMVNCLVGFFFCSYLRLCYSSTFSNPGRQTKSLFCVFTNIHLSSYYIDIFNK
jgi:hypothetical protein